MGVTTAALSLLKGRRYEDEPPSVCTENDERGASKMRPWIAQPEAPTEEVKPMG